MTAISWATARDRAAPRAANPMPPASRAHGSALPPRPFAGLAVLADTSDRRVMQPERVAAPRVGVAATASVAVAAGLVGVRAVAASPVTGLGFRRHLAPRDGRALVARFD
jgi:hypothetical protein